MYTLPEFNYQCKCALAAFNNGPIIQSFRVTFKYTHTHILPQFMWNDLYVHVWICAHSFMNAFSEQQQQRSQCRRAILNSIEYALALFICLSMLPWIRDKSHLYASQTHILKFAGLCVWVCVVYIAASLWKCAYTVSALLTIIAARTIVVIYVRVFVHFLLCAWPVI